MSTNIKWNNDYSKYLPSFTNGRPESSVFLIKTSKSTIYSFYELIIKEYIIKDEIQRLATKREYDVGMIANEYPYLVKTVGYFEHHTTDNFYSYIVVKNVPGASLLKYSLEYKIDINIFHSLLIIIRILQKRANFTHYNLKLSKIMIGVSKKPETIVSGSCRVVPNFAITILDLSYAHIEGIEPGYVRLHPQVTNVIISPNIHDPLFDFISIYDAMKPVYGIDREIESIVNNNKVIEDNIIGTRRYYPMRDLYQGLCIWSTYNPNGLSVDIVTNLYAKYLVGLAYDLGLSLGPILVGATELNYRVEYIANNIDPEPFFKNIDELSKHQQIRSVFVTMISGAYATEKMELISQYTSTSDDILRQCLKYLRFNSRKQSYSNVDTTTILISE